MKHTTKAFHFTLLSLVAVTIASQAKANLITNGSFETLSGTIPTNGVCTSNTSVFGYGACSATGWTGNYQIGNGVANGGASSFYIPQPDPNGKNALILQTYFSLLSSSATQSVSIPATGDYTLSFYVADRTAGALFPGPQTLFVSLNGATLTGGKFSQLPSAWTVESLDIQATAGTNSFTFAGLPTSTTDAAVFIDDVSLTPVTSNSPEPSSWLLSVAGCLLIVLSTAFKHRKAGPCYDTRSRN